MATNNNCPVTLNGRTYVPASNNAPARQGRRKPTQRSRNFAAARRSTPQPMLMGCHPTHLPVWRSFPNEQWHEIGGFSFPKSWSGGNFAIMNFKNEFDKVKSLHSTTKIYSVMLGFTCLYDGYAGFVAGTEGKTPTAPVAPDRMRVKAGKYGARQHVYAPGTATVDASDLWFVWQFDSTPKDGDSDVVAVTKIYISTMPLPGLKPPPNFLVCEE